MIQNVSSHKGYLEATLKYSGSLLLWSGGQRFYSKNSTDNAFTKVGELLLLRHFQRAWPESADSVDSHSHSEELWRKKYRECSDYIQRHRLTLSFEVVTSLLGHHGAIPHRDYLILIAVANRNINRNGNCGCGCFMSTPDLVEMAQSHRLPHNDAWMFTDRESALRLFDLYDLETREDGLACDVVNALRRAVTTVDVNSGGGGGGGGGSCASSGGGGGGHAKSMYPHEVFQGEILEGIVIRYVPYDFVDVDVNMDVGGNVDEEARMRERDRVLETIHRLCSQSDDILKLIPPSTTNVLDVGEGVNMNVNEKDDRGNDIRYIDLRKIQSEVGGNGEMDEFDARLEQILVAFHGAEKRHIYRRNTGAGADEDADSDKRMKKVNLNKIAKEILSSTHSACACDEESKQIAQLIRTLDELRVKVTYKIMVETGTLQVGDHNDNMEQERYFCIVQIHHDSSFQKYHQAIRERARARVASGGTAVPAMKLYRGFSFQLLTDDDVDIDVERDVDMDVDAKRRGEKL